MSDSLKIQGVVEVSTEGAESSLGRVGNAADKMAVNMSAAGAKAGKAVDQIGEIAKATGEKFTRAESAITGSFKKLAVEAAKGKSVLEGLGNIEFNIAAKGLDPAKFKEMGTVVRQLAAEYSHLETAQARTAGSNGQLASRLQNSSYQLQDFIVQVNGGVDATKALGQQLPQLLVGFGAAGAAIGVVAALLPNIIAAFSNSADGAKKFSDALSDFDKAVGDVGSTVKSFDMEKLYEEFNNSSSAVRAATIEQIKFQQEYIKTTQLVAGKKFGESLGGMGEYSTLDKLAGSYGSSGAEKLAKQLGVTVEVAKDLLPVLGGLKSGSEDVGLAFSKFGTTLLGGNAKAVELAQTMATLSKSERDGAAASSALSEAQAKMAKGHIVTKKEAEAAAKATKASSKATEEFANLLDKINGKESGLNAEYWNELERLNAAYKSGQIPLDAYSDLVDKLTKQQPFYVKGLKDEAEALKDITDLERERAKYAADISKETKDLIEKADAAEYENSKIGATEQQLIALTAARYDEQIALKEEKIAAIEMMEGRNAEVEAIEQQISALRRLQSAEIAKPKLREQAREWEKFSDDINRALTDALMRGFESGKSFGENFVDSLKNSLKTAALKIVVNYVTNGAGQLVGTLGNAAINGVMGTSGSNGGAGTNYLGTASNLNTAYGAYNTAQIGYQYAAGTMSGANAAGTVFANATGTGLDGLLATNGAFGTAAETGWASMLGEAATGAWVLAIPAIAGAISAAGSRKAYEFDGVAIKGDYAGSNFTGSAATKWEADGGWWESGDKMKKWMPLTGDKDAIIEAFFGGGLSRNGMTGYVTPVSGEYSKAIDMADLGDLRDTPAIAGVDNSALVASWDADYAAWQKANPRVWSGIGWAGSGEEWTGGERPEEVSGYMPSWQGAGFYGAVSKTPVLSTDPVMLAALDNAIDAIFKATQTSFKALADQFDDTDLAGKVNAFSTSINLDTKSGDIDKVLAALASDVNAKMAQAFLPSIETLRLPEEAWQTAFTRVMVEVAGTSRILDMMGMSIKDTFGSDTNKAITAIDGLSKAFGGIDALSTSFSAYYANFYSQEEQRAQAMEDMGKSFDALNVTMPTTREGFRALVDSLDLATVGGQASFKSLMDLQGVFANLVPAIDSSATSVEALAAAAKELADWKTNTLSQFAPAKTAAQAAQEVNSAGLYGDPGALMTNMDLAGFNAAIVEVVTGANDATRLLFEGQAGNLTIIQDYLTGIGEAAEQAAIDQTQGEIDTLIATFGDLAGAMAEINLGSETLVDAWRRTKNELNGLVTGLAEALGELPAPTALDNLKATLGSLASATKGISSINDQIYNLRTGAGDQAAIDLMKSRESSLFADLATSADPGAVSAELASTMMQRISAEAKLATKGLDDVARLEKDGRDLRIKSLQDQISATERLVDFTQSLKGFVADLKFSDLSALNPTDQLGAAQTNYSSILDLAKAGDDNARGNLQSSANSYLQEAQGYYGGATSQYADIYGSVISQLGDLSLTPVSDISLMTDQLTALQAIETSSAAAIDTTGPQIIALESIRAVLNTREDQLEARAAEDRAAVQAQIELLRTTVANQETQIRQQTDIYNGLVTVLETHGVHLDRIATAADTAAAAP